MRGGTLGITAQVGAAIVLLVPVTSLSAQQAAPRLSMHGYLTQAYGVSSRYPTMGMTKEGTADYRRVAVLARYEASPANHFIVQVAQRRRGDSPTMQFEPEVTLDMAFFEHRFYTGTSVRVGKIAMPFGIYNEVRYAGTLTPFYRAPFVVYNDGAYTSETIDGASAGHVFRPGDAWEFSADAYAGSFRQLEFGTTYPEGAAPVYVGGTLYSRDAYGGQLWVSPPVPGLRLGVGARRQTDVGGIYDRLGGSASRTWIASADWSISRVALRAERSQIFAYGFNMTAQYVQAGIRLMPSVALNVQTELRDEKLRYTPTGSWFGIQAARDNAVGLNLHLTPSAVIKIEGHRNSGYEAVFERTVDPRGAPLRGSYFISSFSVSF